MPVIGFLGTGHIAVPMARALARDGHTVIVSERSADVAAALVKAGLGISMAGNQQLVDAADIVLLSLRPAVWHEVTAALRFRAGQHIISVMAGVPRADIAAACAPASDISVTIPYGYIENGGCPLPVAGDPAALRSLFGKTNPILPQRDEAALRHHFAASTLTTAVLSLLMHSSDWLATQTGDRDAAEVYVAHLVSGFLANLPKERSGQLAAERASLASPDTLNLQMVEALTQTGAFDNLPAILTKISNSMRQS